MKAHIASLMNGLILIGFGLWAYLGSDSRSETALIPVGIGVVLLALYPGVKKENKIVAHIAVLLTLLILVGLVKPLLGALDRNGLAVMRVVVMMVSTLVALVFFIKSFIDVRRARVEKASEGN